MHHFTVSKVVAVTGLHGRYLTIAVMHLVVLLSFLRVIILSVFGDMYSIVALDLRSLDSMPQSGVLFRLVEQPS